MRSSTTTPCAGWTIPPSGSSDAGGIGSVVTRVPQVLRNVRLSEAPSHGLPALIYDLKCPGSEAYIRLARELIGRLPQLAVAA